MRNGDHYVINGTKRFITGANKADFLQLMAATDRSKGSHGGISCFLVDMNTPGIKLGTSYQTMMGDRPWEIILEDVRVPVTHRIGEEGGNIGPNLAGIGNLLRQAALDLRSAARRPAGDPVEARRHLYRAAGGAAPGLQGSEPPRQR